LDGVLRIRSVLLRVGPATSVVVVIVEPKAAEGR